VKDLNVQGRILLVDDDADWIELVQVFLSGLTLGMMTAKDGLEALSILQEEKVDLAIIDTNMPRMNGVELLKFMYAHFPSIPVVMFFSGLVGGLVGIEELRKWGANLILEKSQAPTHLLTIVADFLMSLELQK
jgi:CheY-like chemotaxis protein